MTCYHGFHLLGSISSFGSACCDSATTTDPKGHSKRHCWPHKCTTVATSVPYAFSVLCQGSSSGVFSFQGWAFHQFLSVDAIQCLLSGCSVAIIFTSWDSTIGVAPVQPYGYTHGRHMCLLVMLCDPQQDGTEWLLPPLLQVGRTSCSSISSLPSHSINMVGQTTLGAQRSNLIPLPSLHGGRVFFPTFCSTQWQNQLQICDRC